MPLYDFDLTSVNAQQNSDICIVGAGVVGLSTAVKLAQQLPHKKIVLLESGGATPDAAQAANEGEIIGNNAYALISSRARALGGSQWFWGGNSRPLQPIDFKKRNWVANSGWPISYAQFSEHIESATQLLDIDNSDWSNQHPNLKQVKLNNTELFDHTHFKLSPQITHTSEVATGTFYQSKQTLIESLDNLDIITHATVVDYQLKDNHSGFASLTIANLQQKQHVIKAESFIFAAGALENARILKYFTEKDDLNLPCRDVIGKYFMEHPHRFLNILVSGKEIHSKYQDYFGKFVGSAMHQARFTLSENFQRQEKLNNCTLTFLPSDQKNNIKGAFSREQVLFVVALMEQEPQASNYIQLDAQKDIFNIPKIKLHWSLSDQDWTTLKKVSKTVDQFVGVNRLGRSFSKTFNRKVTVRGGHHHMGTTRMGTSPTEAVVDKDCRVFGLDNVYMAGGSVFPTGGAVNPTINMVILAQRLADTIIKKHAHE
ncbi:FAD-dependent oxidoreductase [Marinicella sp. W31]|uniref:FAD-dependent oxidoreductase n=1 Tax=Marinicella sp. W31 TaxID=3023713 RepID=UPI003756E929